MVSVNPFPRAQIGRKAATPPGASRCPGGLFLSAGVAPPCGHHAAAAPQRGGLAAWPLWHLAWAYQSTAAASVETVRTVESLRRPSGSTRETALWGRAHRPYEADCTAPRRLRALTADLNHSAYVSGVCCVCDSKTGVSGPLCGVTWARPLVPQRLGIARAHSWHASAQLPTISGNYWAN